MMEQLNGSTHMSHTNNADPELISAAEAFRRLGIKQGGPVRDQARRIGLRFRGRRGPLGGVYLVSVDDVERIRAKREREQALQAKQTKPPAQAELPLDMPKVEPIVDKIATLPERMDKLEAKIDRLLAIWDAAE